MDIQHYKYRMPKRLTSEIFIEKARQIHGNKYNYSQVNYKNNRTKVCIICPTHGEFWQTPHNHLQGYGCIECGKERIGKSMSSYTEEFIEKARQIHGSKYNYSQVDYKNNRTKVCIICPTHGEFWQTPHNHLQGYGCTECGKERIYQIKSSCTEEFIEKAKRVHKEKYSYSRVKYVNNYTKVCIICPSHGEFWQTPSDHLSGHACPECKNETIGRIKSSCTEEFIEKAKRIHGNRYNYSNVEYKGSHTKVCIICPCHGEFWQTPSDHLVGRGCPKCRMSHLEQVTMNILKSENIKFETQKKFVWLKTDKGKMSLDFYLPDYHTAIECQGVQHYNAIGMFTEENVFRIKQRDKLKNELCIQHGIGVYYIKYDDDIKESLYNLIKTLNTQLAIEEKVNDILSIV